MATNTTSTLNVVRYVVTHIDQSGLRVMCGPGQGRMTYETAELARQHLEAMMANNPVQDGRLAGAYGLPLEVRPVLAYPGHFDPVYTSFERIDSHEVLPFLGAHLLINEAVEIIKDHSHAGTAYEADQVPLIVASDNLYQACNLFSADLTHSDKVAANLCAALKSIADEFSSLLQSPSEASIEMIGERLRSIRQDIPGFHECVEADERAGQTLSSIYDY